jgi:hypothetical protein
VQSLSPFEQLRPIEQRILVDFFNERPTSPGQRFDSARDLFKWHRAELLLRGLSGVPLSPLQNRILPSKEDKPYFFARRFSLYAGDEAERAKKDSAWKAFKSKRSSTKARLEDLLRFLSELRSGPIEGLQDALSPRLWRCRTCAKVFLAPDQKKRAYCARRCASRATASTAVRKYRNKVHTHKLARARAAIKRCPPGRDDWKAWVSFRAGVTRNWLTYAVGHGELKDPK